jgi:hypothetical protein
MSKKGGFQLGKGLELSKAKRLSAAQMTSSTLRCSRATFGVECSLEFGGGLYLKIHQSDYNKKSMLEPLAGVRRLLCLRQSTNTTLSSRIFSGYSGLLSL